VPAESLVALGAGLGAVIPPGVIAVLGEGARRSRSASGRFVRWGRGADSLRSQCGPTGPRRL